MNANLLSLLNHPEFPNDDESLILPIGMTDDNHLISINMEKSPAILIGGTTGSDTSAPRRDYLQKLSELHSRKQSVYSRF